MTLDKDFGTLAVRDGLKHCGLIQLVDIPARSQGPLCVELLENYSNELQSGAILTVDANRVRIRLP